MFRCAALDGSIELCVVSFLLKLRGITIVVNTKTNKQQNPQNLFSVPFMVRSALAYYYIFINILHEMNNKFIQRDTYCCASCSPNSILKKIYKA